VNAVCWKWLPPRGYRSTFGPETVNVLHRMVSRYFPALERFICVTDDPTGLEDGIEIVPIFNDFAHVPSPHGGNNPSCYRRLRMFHPDAEQWFGKRFVSLDLDVVITGDLRPLWDRPEEIVFWGDTNTQPGSHYNGSMMLMTAGCRPQVWTDFDPLTSPRKALASQAFGSDQGWISYRLGPGEAKWSKADGVYSFRIHIERNGRRLPSNAKVVVFHGRNDPWERRLQAVYPWIAEHYH
jgi:hypothetical protein